MASQKPAFEFQPPLIDVWRQLRSADDTVRNESDSPMAKEIDRAVALLQSRDRQLEDYLTGLQGFSGAALFQKSSGVLTYQGNFPGVGNVASETWTSSRVYSVVFNRGVKFGAGKFILLEDIQITFGTGLGTLATVPQSSYSSGVEFLGGVVNAPNPFSPWGLASGGGDVRIGAAHVVIGSLSDVTQVSSTSSLVIVQPSGSTAFNTSMTPTFTERTANLVVLQVN